MRVKLFTQDKDKSIEYLEKVVNEFVASLRGASIRHVAVSSSDIERIAAVWYEEPGTSIAETHKDKLAGAVPKRLPSGNAAVVTAARRQKRGK